MDYLRADIFYLAIIKELAKSKIPLAFAKSALHLIHQRFMWVADFENYKNESFEPFGWIRITDNNLYLDVANINPESVDSYLMIKDQPVTITLNFSKIFNSIRW